MLWSYGDLYYEKQENTKEVKVTTCHLLNGAREVFWKSHFYHHLVNSFYGGGGVRGVFCFYSEQN